jgi:radical SAM-linked protein
MPDDDRRPPTEPRQRWRIVFRRGEEARFLAHLDAMKLWERAFRRAGIPVAQTEGFNPRPRIVFAAPLPLGLLAEREIVDLVLCERLTRHDLRVRLERDLPNGFGLVDLYDVWVNAPSVAARLESATYRVAVAGAPSGEIARGITELLGADRLDRRRVKEKKTVEYDLRPLVLDLCVDDGAGVDGSTVDGGDRTTVDGVGGPVAVSVRMRLRHAQEEGTGRPEEVVAALGELLGQELGTERTVRERLELAGDDRPERSPAARRPPAI